MTLNNKMRSMIIILSFKWMLNCVANKKLTYYYISRHYDYHYTILVPNDPQ